MRLSKRRSPGRKKMIKIETLDKIIEQMKIFHGARWLKPTGLNCYASLREPNGKKVIFSIIKGTQFINCSVNGDDALTFEHMSRGIGKFATMTSHSIYLSDLRIINLYETFGEFLTTDKIDFMYSVKGTGSFTMLSSLELLPPPPVLAQWTYNDDKLERSLEDLGKTVILEREQPRLELDFS